MTNGTGTNGVILDTFRAIWVVTSRPGPAMGILNVGSDLIGQYDKIGSLGPDLKN